MSWRCGRPTSRSTTWHGRQGAEVELVELRPEGRLGARSRPHRRCHAAGRRARVVVDLHRDPPGMLVERGGLRRARRARGSSRRDARPRRGLPRPRARPRSRAFPAAADRSSPVFSVVGDLEVLRLRRPARGLACDARSRPARRRRPGARLHLALPRVRRPPRCSESSRCGPRTRCSRGAASASSRPTCRSSTSCSPRTPRSSTPVRPTAGSISYPRYLGDKGMNTFNERLVAEQACCSCPARVRLRRRALPPGLRAPRPARGGRAARPAASRVTAYDRIGRTYADAPPRPAHRAADRRRARRRAQRRQRGRRRGCVEPRDREVVAVEPSAVMLAQRPPAPRRGPGAGRGAAVRRTALRRGARRPDDAPLATGRRARRDAARRAQRAS